MSSSINKQLRNRDKVVLRSLKPKADGNTCYFAAAAERKRAVASLLSHLFSYFSFFPLHIPQQDSCPSFAAALIMH